MIAQQTWTAGKGRAYGIAVITLALMLVLAGVIEQRAMAQSGDFTPRSKQAILMEADTGAVLFQHNADEPMYPASMSKLMTLLLMFKAIKAGTLKMEDEVLMSVNAWRRGGAPSGGSAMMVPVGTRVTVQEILQGIIVESGNDASIAIAEHIAGSEELFAKEMTEQARAMGLKTSVFKNATGLFNPDHVTTARELAVLARHIIKEYPSFYPMFSQREFRYRKHRFINRNPLLSLDIGVDGLKTGYIKESGYGIIVSAKQGDRRLIAVINGLASASDRQEEARRLLDWGFRAFTEFRLFDDGEVVGRARVWGGNQFYLPLTGDGHVSVLLPRAAAGHRLKAEIVYNSPLKPPIKKGDAVAKLRITNNTSTTNEVPLYAAEDVGAAGTMRRGLDSLAYMAFRWIP